MNFVLKSRTSCSALFRYLLFASFVVVLVGCNDIPSTPTYCESHVCKESTEVRQRPTLFALELLLNDSNHYRMAHLFTLDCDYLPDEDSTQYSTFCVDSLKFGDSNKRYHLPQTNKYSYAGNIPYSIDVDLSKEDGRYLDSYVEIPIDDDDHLRFTLVDRKNKEKKFDIDLSDYLNMYELHGDTFDLNFPKNTYFSAYSRDTTFSKKDCDLPLAKVESFGCYEYSVKDEPRTDTTVYCIAEQGDSYENVEGYIQVQDFIAIPLSSVGDSSACKSQKFHVEYYHWPLMHNEYVPCYRLDLDSVPATLSISNLYSRRLMNDAVVDSVGERLYRWHDDQADSTLVSGHRHVWHTITRMEKQGPDKEDRFKVYTFYRDME